MPPRGEGLLLKDGRYFLGGRALENGSRVQLMLIGNQMEQWIEGHFHWNGRPASWPALRFALGGQSRAVENESPLPSAVMLIPPEALLRWPAL